MSSGYLKLSRDINPSCNLPRDLESAVWRYMDWWKFESLLVESALYLCRADRLQDRFEGTYSRQQLLEMNAWLNAIEHPSVADSERQLRKRDRQRSFINSWCVGETDFDLMWKAYVRNPPGVVVRSTVGYLQKVCDNAIELWPIDISLVQYFDRAGGQHINYSGTPTVFFHKDIHFHLENELRIVHWPNITDDPPEHVWLPVSLDQLIVSVVLSPGTHECFAVKAREALDRSGLNSVPVEYSRDDRECAD